MNIANPPMRACWLRLKLLLSHRSKIKAEANGKSKQPHPLRKHRRTTAFFEMP